jgi:hypothetical protein
MSLVMLELPEQTAVSSPVSTGRTITNFLSRSIQALRADFVAFSRPLLKKSTYFRLFMADHCPLPLPWFRFEQRSDPVAMLHRIALRSGWLTASPKWRLAFFLQTLVWPVASAVRAARIVRRYGGVVAADYKIGRIKQWWQQYLLANTSNITPESYYKFKLFLPERRRNTDFFIQHHEIISLLPYLNRHLSVSADTGPISSKTNFNRICLAAGLPTPPILAFIDRQARLHWMSAIGHSFPKCDLFVKYNDYWCGIGAELWRYNEAKDVWQGPVGELDAEKLKQHCLGLTSERPVVIQSRLQNSSEMAQFSRVGLCTIRIVTYRNRNMEVQLLVASLRMPVGDACVDNLAAGGIAAPVNLETGKLGQAVSKDVRNGVFIRHPDTGATIEGAVLPNWGAARELVEFAHRFINVPFIGWDVALTTNGPILVEANEVWCAELVQMPSGAPIGKTRFPDWYLECLRLRPADSSEDRTSRTRSIQDTSSL